MDGDRGYDGRDEPQMDELRSNFMSVQNFRAKPVRLNTEQGPTNLGHHILKSIFLLLDIFLHHCPSLRRYCAIQKDQEYGPTFVPKRAPHL